MAICKLIVFDILFHICFRCSATNENFIASKQIQHSLESVNSITANNAKLLPPLQKDELFVANGSTIILHCAPTTTATKKGNAVRWYFRKRAQSTAPPIVLKATNPNELHISNVSIEQHDGFYTCSFADEYHQVCKAFHFINYMSKAKYSIFSFVYILTA